MHRLKNMEETLISCIQTQMADLKNADTEELGDAIDMVKDLAQARYYCQIVKAMEDAEKEEENGIQTMYVECPSCRRAYTEKIRYNAPYDPSKYNSPYDYSMYPMDRDMDRDIGRMYFTERAHPRNSQGEFITKHYGDGNTYHQTEVPMTHDTREGRSHMTRRNYMEAKELHQTKDKKLKELEKYMKELSDDIVEMIEDASPEEKQMLEKKMTHLTSKIAQLNNA